MFERDHEERVKVRTAKDTWQSPGQWETGSCFCQQNLWKLRSGLRGVRRFLRVLGFEDS